MLLKTLFIEVASAFSLGVIVRSFSILVNFKRPFSRLWHINVHESCCILLKLRSLRLYFKLIIAEESRSIFTVNARFLIDLRCLLRWSTTSLDFEAWIGLIFTVKCCSIGIKLGASRSFVSILAKESGFVFSVSITICGNDLLLDLLERITDCVCSVKFAM